MRIDTLGGDEVHSWMLEVCLLAGTALGTSLLYRNFCARCRENVRCLSRQTAGGGALAFSLMEGSGGSGEESGGDSDMKIAPEYPSRRKDEQPRQNEELNELFQEVVENRQNGNREKAVRLGQELACDAVDSHGRAMSGSRSGEPPLLTCHRKILFAFAVDQIIDRKAANPLVAEVISSSFYGELKRRDPVLYQEIQRSGAFSLYLLCSRERPPQGYGVEFARFIQRPEEPQAIRLGDALYEEYVRYLEEKMDQTDFIP